MNKIIPIFIAVLSVSCSNEKPRETILDNISHVEADIYYSFDSVPRLCDELRFEGRYIDVGDCRLYCELRGKGAPMVLINGGPGGTHHYFHPWFSKAEKYCETVYYDQRGCGLSDFARGDGYTFKQAVTDLDKLRQKSGFDKWIVCGYSYGGALAQYYCLTYPEHVEGVVLISAAPVLQDPILDESREYDYMSEEELDRISEIYDLYRKQEIDLKLLLYNKELNGDWKRQSFYKPDKKKAAQAALYEWVNDKGFNGEVGSDYGRYDFKGAFDGCPVPTLICEGRWDLTWKAEKADILKNNHPNAKMIIFEKAGHEIFAEEPERFFPALEQFVKSLKPVSPDQIAAWKSRVDEIIGKQEIFFAREDEFVKLIKNEGIDKATIYYEEFKKNNPDEKPFSENVMNNTGYRFLNNKDFETALKIFELNIREYPESWNVYDSFAEAYLEKGDKTNAGKYYEKALSMNPDNQNIKNILSKLK